MMSAPFLSALVNLRGFARLALRMELDVRVVLADLGPRDRRGPSASARFAPTADGSWPCCKAPTIRAASWPGLVARDLEAMDLIAPQGEDLGTLIVGLRPELYVHRYLPRLAVPGRIHAAPWTSVNIGSWWRSSIRAYDFKSDSIVVQCVVPVRPRSSGDPLAVFPGAPWRSSDGWSILRGGPRGINRCRS